MSKAYVPVELWRQVAEEARYRCGYCLTAQRIIGRPMVMDHRGRAARISLDFCRTHDWSDFTQLQVHRGYANPVPIVTRVTLPKAGRVFYLGTAGSRGAYSLAYYYARAVQKM